MPQKSAADIIAAAKKAYTDAGGGKMTTAPTPAPTSAPAPAKVTPPPAKPSGTAANAPYSMAKDARDIGASIRSNIENAKKALGQ